MKQKAILKFALICEHAFEDKGERLSIIQAYDTIDSNTFPAVHPKLTVVTSYSNVENSSNIKQQVLITSPSEEKVASNVIELTNIPSQNINFLSFFINTVFKEEGQHRIQILLNDKKITNLILNLRRNG